jgi:hypothetical protein
MSDLNPAEQRAFEFGPEMRRNADHYCGGSLSQAYYRFSTPERVAQHEIDRAAVRQEHRAAFIAAIRDAGGFR